MNIHRPHHLRLVCPAIALALTILAFLDALELSSRLAQNSDSVLSFLRAHEILQGNVLLSGWSVQVDNFYFTDTLPFVVAELFVGPDRHLLATVPAIVYALFVLAALACSLAPSRSLTQNLGAGAVAVLLLVPPHWFGDWDPVLLSNFHLGTVLGGLLALRLAARCLDVNVEPGRVGQIGNLLAVFFLTAATVASDPFSLVFAFGPSLAVMGFDALLRQPSGRETACILTLVAGVVFGVALPEAIAWSGGFSTINFIHGHFVEASEFGRNITAVVFGLLRLVGAYPFGLELNSWPAALTAIRCVGFALMASGVCRTVVLFFRGRTLPLFDRMLCASVFGVLAACCMSAQYNGEIAPGTEWSGGAAIRYLVPVPLLAAVLAMRQVPELIARLQQRPRLVAQGALLFLALPLLLGGEWFVGDFSERPDWISSSPPSTVVRWLEMRRLSHGVGEYWSGSLISALSSDTIRVAPVAPAAGILQPSIVATSSRWYAQAPQFVIWQDANQAGISLENVRATYGGRIRQVALVGGYRIALLAD